VVHIKEQMGHSSIRITADCYAHLQPVANIGYANKLDPQTSPHTSATQTQTTAAEKTEEVQDIPEVIDTRQFPGGPGRIRTYNQQIMSLLL
jgi:hypothetical protein